MSEQRLNELKSKYQPVLNVMNQLGAKLRNVHIQDNKLFLRASVGSQEAKNKIWDHIKQVDSTYPDLTADIVVERQTQMAAATAGGGTEARTHQVQPGETLSRISQHYYGNANLYMRIFEANRDKLSDPNKIQVGQSLVIPD